MDDRHAVSAVRPVASRLDASLIDEVLHRLGGEAPAQAEMRRIKAWAEAGIESMADRQRYRSLWVALTLRRSVCRRSPMLSAVHRAAARWKAVLDDVQHERARLAVEAAFGPDDAPREGVGSPLPR
jgi:hypothetical protein